MVMILLSEKIEMACGEYGEKEKCQSKTNLTYLKIYFDQKNLVKKKLLKL